MSRVASRRAAVPLLVVAVVLMVVLAVLGVIRLLDPPGEGEGCGGSSRDGWCGAPPGNR